MNESRPNCDKWFFRVNFKHSQNKKKVFDNIFQFYGDYTDFNE